VLLIADCETFRWPQVPNVIGIGVSENNSPIVKTETPYMGSRSAAVMKNTKNTTEDKTLKRNASPRERREKKRFGGDPKFAASVSA
jgi:hypothetical protein